MRGGCSWLPRLPGVSKNSRLRLILTERQSRKPRLEVRRWRSGRADRRQWTTNRGQSRDLRNDQWESASLVMRPPGGARRIVRGSEKPCGPAVSPGGNGEENLPRLLAWLRRWTASQCRADSTQRGGQGKRPLGERHASQRGAGKNTNPRPEEVTTTSAGPHSLQSRTAGSFGPA
jgi:hypothetical protein